MKKLLQVHKPPEPEIEEIDLSEVADHSDNFSTAENEDDYEDMSLDFYDYDGTSDPYDTLNNPHHISEEFLLDADECDYYEWMKYAVPEADQDRHCFPGGLDQLSGIYKQIAPIHEYRDPVTGRSRWVVHSTSGVKPNEVMWAMACTQSFSLLPNLKGAYSAHQLAEEMEVSTPTAKKIMKARHSGYIQVSLRYFLTTKDFEILVDHPDILRLIRHFPKAGCLAIQKLKEFTGFPTSHNLRKYLGPKAFNILVGAGVLKSTRSLRYRDHWYFYPDRISILVSSDI